MPARIKILFFFIVLGLFLPKKALAAFSFKIESITPTSISSKSQEVEILLTIIGLPSESFFRVAWQETQGKPYFGYLKNNNGDWVQVKPLDSEECSDYYKVSQTGDGQVTLVAKVGEDVEITSGSYLLKAHRFTVNCGNTPSENSVAVEVNLPTPTLLPSSTPIPTLTPSLPTLTSTPKPPTPTPTAKSSTPTPTPKPLTPTPTLKPPTGTPTPKTTLATAAGSGEILGQEESSPAAFYPWEASQEAELASEAGRTTPNRLLPAILLGAGFILLFSVAFWLWYTQLRNK